MNRDFEKLIDAHYDAVRSIADFDRDLNTIRSDRKPLEKCVEESEDALRDYVSNLESKLDLIRDVMKVAHIASFERNLREILGGE